MVELLIAVVLLACCASSVALAVHGGRRRSRARAERVLDDLAAAACAALADGGDVSRRAVGALARYDRAREHVARARTCRELELIVARHRLRLGAEDLLAQAGDRVRALLAEGVAVRR
jgi:hypothetical protein